MNHSHQLYFMQTYKFPVFHANIYRYRIKHISIHQSMTKQIILGFTQNALAFAEEARRKAEYEARWKAEYEASRLAVE